MSDDAAPPDEPPRPRLRRTWPQRLTIIGIFLSALACFAAAGALYAGQRIVEDRNIAPAIVDPATNTSAGFTPNGQAPDGLEAGGGDGVDAGGAEAAERPVSTFPPAEPNARNFLITGADNNSCIDPDSPYAPAFGDRSNFGERSDTIMMWRVNPATSQAAVLSFPRDLWVTIAGRSNKQRINVAYERDNSQRLIDTIYQNFGINTDHTIQIDFCAFKTLVDAVDGVAVPFDTAVRDVKTGLNVPEPGCFTFDGDHALAYVRSRFLQTFVDGKWVTDPTSDLGRISRQQDFIRRVAQRLLSAGIFNPDVIGGLIETNSEYIVTDPSLTVNKMLEFAGVMSRIDPAQITTYQIEARGETRQGNSVLIPRIEGQNMQGILAVFRGEASLEGAPEQIFADATTTVPAGTGDVTTTTAEAGTGDTGDVIATTVAAVTTLVAETADSVPPTTVEPTPFTPLPTVSPEQNVFGVVPDSTISC